MVESEPATGRLKKEVENSHKELQYRLYSKSTH